MIDALKTAAFSLVMTLAVLPPWQIAEAADSVRGRHSLIHRPQIQPAPALKPTASAPQPQLHTSPHSVSTPPQPIQRKIVRRPAPPAAPIAEVAPMVQADSAQIDPPQAPQSDHFDDAPPEPDMIPPPEPPHTEAQ